MRKWALLPLVLALLPLLSAAPAHAVTTSCAQLQIPVAHAEGQPVDHRVAATFCTPGGSPAARDVDVLAYFNNDWEGFAVRNARDLRAMLQRAGAAVGPRS